MTRIRYKETDGVLESTNILFATQRKCNVLVRINLINMSLSIVEQNDDNTERHVLKDHKGKNRFDLTKNARKFLKELGVQLFDEKYNVTKVN